MARNALGRGLSALIPSAEANIPTTARESVQQIDIDLLEPNADQPRTRFPEPALIELADSIRENGVIQPLLVKRIGQKYQIVAGERRWRAAQRAGLLKVPALVREFSKQDAVQIGLIENLQREDLNPIDAATALTRLMEDFGLTQEEVAERTGLDRAVVANTVRLLKLDPDCRHMIYEGRLTAGHGKALLGLKEADRYQVALQAARQKKSVRWIETWGRKEKAKQEAPPADPNIDAALHDLILNYATKIEMRPYFGGKEGGELVFHFTDGEDLARLYDLLMKIPDKWED
jgi:ParB family chromosome partitioning protein